MIVSAAPLGGPWPELSLAAALAAGGSALAASQAVRTWAEPARRRIRRLDGPASSADDGAPIRSGRTRTSTIVRRLGRSAPARLLPIPTASESAARDVDRVRGHALLAIMLLTAVGAILALASPMGAVAFPLLVVVGLRIPAMRAARHERANRRALEAQAPELVELLLATTRAGAGVGSALDRAAGLMLGPLGEELARAAGRVGLGEPWSVALDDLASKTASPSLQRLGATLARSGRLGTPVAAALKGLADDLRSVRRARAEESARRAPVKMLFPLVFLILPAFLLLTVGPVFLATVRSLS